MPKLGLAQVVQFFLPSHKRYKGLQAPPVLADDDPRDLVSLPTRPFIDPLPLPPAPHEVPPFEPDQFACPPGEDLMEGRFMGTIGSRAQVSAHPPALRAAARPPAAN